MEATKESPRLAPYEARSGCRVCGGVLCLFLDMGKHPLADFGRKAPNWRYAPLELSMCESCHLVQLRHTVTRDDLYRRYWYRSSTSGTMKTALGDLAHAGKYWVELGSQDVVLDIGCNDGYLLRQFPDCWTIGFDPASIVAEGVDAIAQDYFDANIYSAMCSRPAKLIFTVAMMYDIDAPSGFVADVARALAPDGVWVIQMNDLASMVAYSAYDFIGHEHVCIYSLQTLSDLLAQHGLYIAKAERNMVNGGSLRVFVRHGKKPEYMPDGVWGAHKWERGVLDSRGSLFHTLLLFAEGVGEKARLLHELVKREYDQGALIHIYGASTRGCTIWQTSKLNEALVDMAADVDKAKAGHLIPGTGIPIVSEEKSHRAKPDFYLVGPYGYLEEFIKRETDFLGRGGKFIVPLPEPRIVEGE